MRECYFGKSCSGKSTYLRRLNIGTVDCDPLFSDALIERYGFKRATNFKFLQRNRFVAYVNMFRRGMITDEIKSNFVKRAKWVAHRILDEQYWNIFFDMAGDGDLDWAAVGFYYDIVPSDKFCDTEFIELKEPDFDKRVELCANKHYDKYVLMALDSMYQRPQTEFSQLIIKNPIAHFSKV